MFEKHLKVGFEEIKVSPEKARSVQIYESLLKIHIEKNAKFSWPDHC